MTNEAEPTIEDWKTQVSNDTGVPADVLRGDTIEELQAHAAAIKPLLPPPLPPGTGHVPSEGRTIGKAAANPSTAFAAFLNQQLGYTR